ncbi:MAG: mannose-1-phosphate guanylyltransferase/mannose-6-phosphate isomerase [Methanomicrobiales archaeon]|nr:mannose-1-phosphate guanylyltransferase/mannose-6-phosphate isomerase [Methanomicrobiales archaeon]
MKSIILAGGVGTRLWPLSREYYPKQFIQLDEKSLFQRTYERSLRLSGSNGIFVVTSEIHKYLVQNQVEELGQTLDEEHLLVEPVGKNTLPAITWAMQRIREMDGNGTAIVFPSDHILGDGALDQIRTAMPLAQDHLVTFGIQPSSPHTGYGYIKPGAPVPGGFSVDSFREKPDDATAAEYVRNGYLWNSGIFLLSTGCFFEELARHQPPLATAFSEGACPEYSALPSISIDYGLLEHSKRVAVVPLTAEWSDLGTFRALYDHESRDADNNVGPAEYIAAHGNYVYAPGKHIGLIGVDNLVVVDTPDALLISDNRETERVKELVGRFNAAGDPVTRFHRQVHRPWGSYTILEEGRAYKIKRVTVKPGERLSLQLHHHRSEHWVVVHGTAEVELDGETRLLRKGESTFVRAGALHRLRNPGVIPLEVIEVQLGEYLEEDDIVRFDDEYGRA